MMLKVLDDAHYLSETVLASEITDYRDMRAKTILAQLNDFSFQFCVQCFRCEKLIGLTCWERSHAIVEF